MKYFDPIAKKSIVALIIFELTISLLTTKYNVEFALINLALSALFSLIYPIYMVFLLSKLTNIVGSNVSNKTYGIWSYIWRVLLIKYLSILFSVCIYTVLSYKASPSVQFTLLIWLLSFVTSLFFVWLFFSKDRKGQFFWLAEIFSRT